MNIQDHLEEVLHDWAKSREVESQKALFASVYGAEEIHPSLLKCYSVIARDFARLTARELQLVPPLKDGTNVLVRLLGKLEKTVGTDHDERIHSLIQALQPKAASAGVGLVRGAQVGKYTLVRELGKGGNAEVWQATRVRGDRTVTEALKFLYRADDTATQRFLGEIGTLAELDHEHIVRVYDEGRNGETIYYSMKYIEGNSLYSHTQGKAHPLPQVVAWLKQIASALDYAHTKGVIHRDVKPHNILRQASDGRLYLADFGLYYSVEWSIQAVGKSADDEKTGTTGYIAPEQIPPPYNPQGKSTPQPATDIYSLAIVAYELLTGHLPFDVTFKDDALRKHVNDPLPACDRLPEGDAVLGVLRIACDKSPELRHKTATAFVEALERAPQHGVTGDRVEQYLLEWAEKEGAESDSEFDMSTALGANTQHLKADPLPAQPAPVSSDPRRRIRDEIRAKRQAIANQRADYNKDEESPPRLIENIRKHLLTFEHGVLLGQPGSGKTWTLKRLMTDCLKAYQAGQTNVPIPVFVPLNTYTGAQPFEQYVLEQLGSLRHSMDALHASKRLLLLCDALNEMPNQAVTLDKVRQYLRSNREHLRFVVSCRVLDYQRHLDSLRPLELLTLRDMELTDIQHFIMTYWGETEGKRLWEMMGGSEMLLSFWRKCADHNEADRFWDASAGVPSYTTGTEDQAWRTMHSGARLIPLCRRPFMASLVCGVYDPTQPEQPLPHKRSDLFDGFIKQAVEVETSRNPDFPALEALEPVLTELAKAMQQAKVTVLARTGENLQPIMREVALIDAGIASNILTGDRESVRFSHQLFQEYFAAKVLLVAMESKHAPTQYLSGEWWEEAGVWRETAVILGELDDPNEVARWLAPDKPELALRVLSEHPEVQAQKLSIHPTVRDVLIEVAHSKTNERDPRARAAAYRVLGHPLIDADQREGVALTPKGLPDIAWRDIPAGTYRLGAEDESDNEPYTFQTVAFKMGRYPVTYRQFQCFVDAPDFEDPTWWKDMPEEYTGRKHLAEQEYKYWNHPRESVSWYQAVAFTRWLNHRLKGTLIGEWIIGETCEIRLPHEREWEAGARGLDGRIYPYEGDHDRNKGNMNRTGIDKTSAVGCFPLGASPFGVEDLSGNVWDWCLNEYRNPDWNINYSNKKERALRGGSWYNYDYDARAVYRDLNSPNRRLSYCGFRLVCVPLLNR